MAALQYIEHYRCVHQSSHRHDVIACILRVSICLLIVPAARRRKRFIDERVPSCGMFYSC